MNYINTILDKLDILDIFIYLGGVISFLIGPVTIRIYALLTIIAIDTMFGLQISFRDNTFSLKTLSKKVSSKIYYYFFYLVIFNSIDMIVNFPNTMRWYGILLITFMELTSIYRHVLKLGRSEAGLILEQVLNQLSKQYKIFTESKEDKK